MAVGEVHRGLDGCTLVSLEATHGPLFLQPNIRECCLLSSFLFRGGVPSARDWWLLQASRFVGACLFASVCRRSIGEYLQAANSLPPCPSRLLITASYRSAMGTAITDDNRSSR